MIKHTIKSNFSYISFHNKIWKKNQKNLFAIPNIAEITRELNKKSQIYLILDRARLVGILSLIKIGTYNIYLLKKILAKDFFVGLKLLIEFEIILTNFSKYILHSQLTDMAIALNNPSLLIYYFDLSKKYKFTPGIATYNIGPLINLLSKIRNIPNNLEIYTPVNKNSFLMNPQYEDIIEYLNNCSLKVYPINT